MQAITFVALDCETTGLDATKDKIIEVGATKFTLTDNLETFDSLFNPNVQIPAFVERLTGIQNEELLTAPQFGEKLAELREFCAGSTLIGHNIKFDVGFLASHGLDLSALPSFDTFDLASLVLQRVGSLSLAALADQFGVLHTEAHRALADAEATRDLFHKLIEIGAGHDQQIWQQIEQLNAPEPKWLSNFAQLVQTIAQENPPKPPLEKEEKQVPPTAGRTEGIFEPNQQLATQLTTLLASDSPALLETPTSAEELTATLLASEKPVLLATSHHYTARLLAEQYDLPTVFAPYYYPDSGKVQTLTKRTLTAAEAPFVAKLLLHPRANFWEFNLTRAQRYLWDFVASTEPVQPPTESRILLTDHASLPTIATPGRATVITSVLRLPESLVQTDRFVLDLPTLATLAPAHEDTLTIWWGLLGLLLRAAEPKYGRVELSQITGLKNYTSVRETGRKFLAEARATLPPSVTAALELWLNDESGYLRQLRTNAASEITLVLEPVRQPEQIGKLITKLKAICIGTALTTTPDNFNYTLRLLGLPPTTTTISAEATATDCALVTVTGLPAPNEPSFVATSEAKLVELLNTLPGITTVVFAGQYALRQFFDKAQTKVTRPLFSPRLTGSQGKIKVELKAHETAAYLTTGEHLPDRCRNVILVKFKFVVRDDADWSTETLPEAVLTFRKLWVGLAHVAEKPADQQLIVLDNRLTEKGYGKDFVKATGTTPVGLS